MTKTEARLALTQRQRRFEWELARGAKAAAASALVAGKTHDLLNLVQIVQLASAELATRCDPTGQEFVDDLMGAATEAHRSLTELMAVARPEPVITRGAPVGRAVAAAIDALRSVVDVTIHLATSPETATRCTAAELEHLLIGLALDAPDAPIELQVRERAIDGVPWIEILRSSPEVPGDDRFELRAIEAILARTGGELATSDRRGGGEELVVSLPVVG